MPLWRVGVEPITCLSLLANLTRWASLPFPNEKHNYINKWNIVMVSQWSMVTTTHVVEHVRLPIGHRTCLTSMPSSPLPQQADRSWDDLNHEEIHRHTWSWHPSNVRQHTYDVSSPPLCLSIDINITMSGLGKANCGPNFMV